MRRWRPSGIPRGLRSSLREFSQENTCPCHPFHPPTNIKWSLINSLIQPTFVSTYNSPSTVPARNTRDQNQASAPKELALEMKMGRMDGGDRSEKERQEIKIKFQIVRIARKETKCYERQRGE